MTITRVWIEDGCIGCGLAEAICPEVFNISDNTLNTVIVGADLSSVEAEIKEAAKDCPIGNITYEDVSPGEKAKFQAKGALTTLFISLQHDPV